MRSTCKKLVTDINRNKDTKENILKYRDLLYAQYNCYSTVKVCMNIFTLMELIEDNQEGLDELKESFSTVRGLLKKHLVDRENVLEESVDLISGIRDKIEYKMHALTSYADGYEIYEYILNRVEAGIKNSINEVDIDMLSDRMFRYVFSENDPVVINSKLQLIMSQLPVRMTKSRFFDIVSNTLSIYKGGEHLAVDNFAEMLRASILMDVPSGFDTEYPELYSVYMEACKTDYRELDEKGYDELNDKLKQAAAVIDNEASAYVLFQEIVNDVYAILLTIDNSYETNIEEKGYLSAVKIITACVNSANVMEIPEDTLDLFCDIEGIQENVYENVLILETVLETLKEYENVEYDTLSTVSKLLSSSLFVDLSENSESSKELADEKYISQIKEKLIFDMEEFFKGKSRLEKRSIMSKAISVMPIFLNSQKEIKEYFDYSLRNCRDNSELTAVEKLINDIIME